MLSRIDRAKQFLPFDALQGLQEELRKKEVIYEERIEVSEEVAEQISNTINKINFGNIVKIKYYSKNKYEILKDTVIKIDSVKRKIILSNKEAINIDDIVKIEIVY